MLNRSDLFVFDADGAPAGGPSPVTTPPAPAPAPEPTPAPAPSGETPDGDEPYDKERAMETIRKLRGENKSMKDAAKRLAELEEAEKKRKQAEMTEAERYKAQVTEYEQRMKSVQAEMDTLRKRQEFGLAARKANLTFASAEAEEDAFKLADLSGVMIGQGGKITGMDEAIKELKKSKPYLFGQPVQAPNIDAQPKSTPPGGLDDKRKQELAQRFNLHLPK